MSENERLYVCTDKLPPVFEVVLASSAKEAAKEFVKGRGASGTVITVIPIEGETAIQFGLDELFGDAG